MTKYQYDYPMPAVATDIVVFTMIEDELSILLIERGEEPFRGAWALPGGFIREHEDLDACASRELREETGVEIRLLEPIANFSAPDRDPRGRTISVAYLALTSTSSHSLVAGTDAAKAQWVRCDQLPTMAFDHAAIVAKAREALSKRIRLFDETTMQCLIALLPEVFTLSDIQGVYENIAGQKVDKRNFRRSISTFLVETTGTQRGSHRPAKMYRGASKGVKYEKH